MKTHSIIISDEQSAIIKKALLAFQADTPDSKIEDPEVVEIADLIGCFDLLESDEDEDDSDPTYDFTL